MNEIAKTKDPKTKEMARRTMASQKKEIAEFGQWLAGRGQKGGSGSGASRQSK